jgi:hypothetical protein
MNAKGLTVMTVIKADYGDKAKATIKPLSRKFIQGPKGPCSLRKAKAVRASLE